MSQTRESAVRRQSPHWSVGLVTVGLLVLLVFAALFARSQANAVAWASAAERMRERGRLVAARVSLTLRQGEVILDEIDREISSGETAFADERVERALYAHALRHPDLAEVGFTAGRGETFAEQGRRIVERDGRQQLAVVRLNDGRLWTLRTRPRIPMDGSFFQEVRRRELGGGFGAELPFVEQRTVVMVADPTTHSSFSTPARQGMGAVHSDLQWGDLDDPGSERRVVVSTERAVQDGSGAFRGVLRVAFLASSLAAPLSELSAERDSPIAVSALCDVRGRLIAVGGEPLQVRQDAGDLRMPSEGRVEHIARLLATLGGEARLGSDAEPTQRVSLGGQPHVLVLEHVQTPLDWTFALLASEETVFSNADPGLNAWTLAGVIALAVAGVTTASVARSRRARREAVRRSSR